MKNSFTTALLWLCTLSLFALTTQAQNRAIHITSIEEAHDHTPGRNCHAHTNLLNQIQVDTALEQRMLDMETKVQNYIRQRSVAGGARFTSRVIPVYVHVIYRTSQENISDAQIQSQIDQINDDFAATNGDANLISSSGFAGVAAGNTNISFTLAGVTRKQSSRTSWGTNDAMKDPSQGGVAVVTPNTHLNMWVCNIGGGILGYAQFPNTKTPATDGVVMSPQYFGSRNYGNSGSYYLSAPFDRGRTTTHEIGHYLNLRHIWGDGGCGASDLVGDTPDADGPSSGCPSSNKTTCGTRDMHMNYMDYSDDRCMYMFSNGQKLRMQACLDGPRAQLGSAGSGGGGNPPACDGPFASVSLSLTTDNYGSETSWTVKDASGTTVASGSGYGNNTTITENFTLGDGQYTFEILDGYGDGICCSYGNGNYTLTGDGSQFATGGNFGSSATEVFCIQGGSSGGGGGGSFSYSESFNSNFGGWRQSGSDDFNWSRRSGSTPSSGTGPSAAADGSHYIYTEASSPNNNGKRAIITSPSFDFSNLGSNGTLTFQYHMYSSNSTRNNRMGSVELQVSTNNGSSWTTVWSRSDNQGNQWRTASVSLSNYAGRSSVQLRFNAVTGGWRSDMCIDDLEISSGGNRTASNTTTNTIADVEEVEEITASQINLYPNPANSTINIDLGEITTNYTGRIVDATGRTVWVGELEAGANAINISTLSTGMYYVAVVKANGEVITKKFVKK